MFCWCNINRRLTMIEAKLDLILTKENKMAQSLDAVLADVQAESTVADSIVTLLTSVEQQLKDALAGTSISPANQAKIDAIFDGIESNKNKIAQAVTDNTPAS